MMHCWKEIFISFMTKNYISRKRYNLENLLSKENRIDKMKRHDKKNFDSIR